MENLIKTIKQITRKKRIANALRGTKKNRLQFLSETLKKKKRDE